MDNQVILHTMFVVTFFIELINDNSGDWYYKQHFLVVGIPPDT